MAPSSKIRTAASSPLSEYLGKRTNNYAEYSALLGVLAWAIENKRPRLRVIADSELMVKQMQASTRSTARPASPLGRSRRRVAKLERFEIAHTLRGGNKEADQLANDAMDRGMAGPHQRRPHPLTHQPFQLTLSRCRIRRKAVTDTTSSRSESARTAGASRSESARTAGAPRSGSAGTAGVWSAGAGRVREKWRRSHPGGRTARRHLRQNRPRISRRARSARLSSLRSWLPHRTRSPSPSGSSASANIRQRHLARLYTCWCVAGSVIMADSQSSSQHGSETRQPDQVHNTTCTFPDPAFPNRR